MKSQCVYVAYSIKYPYLPIFVADKLLEIALCFDIPYKTLRNYIHDENHVYKASFTLYKVAIDKS